MKKIIMDSSWILYFASDAEKELPDLRNFFSLNNFFALIKNGLKKIFGAENDDILVVIDEKHPAVERVMAIIIHSCVKSYNIKIIRGWMFIEAKTWNDRQLESVKDLLLQVDPFVPAMNPMRAAI